MQSKWNKENIFLDNLNIKQWKNNVQYDLISAFSETANILYINIVSILTTFK